MVTPAILKVKLRTNKAGSVVPGSVDDPNVIRQMLCQGIASPSLKNTAKNKTKKTP